MASSSRKHVPPKFQPPLRPRPTVEGGVENHFSGKMVSKTILDSSFPVFTPDCGEGCAGSSSLERQVADVVAPADGVEPGPEDPRGREGAEAGELGALAQDVEGAVGDDEQGSKGVLFRA